MSPALAGGPPLSHQGIPKVDLLIVLISILLCLRTERSEERKRGKQPGSGAVRTLTTFISEVNCLT